MSALPSVLPLFDLVPPSTFLSSYTFRTMLVGTTAVGATAGALGSFLYLHKQSLVSDVIGHAATLGVALSFVVASVVLGIDGRTMLVLTVGSVIASTLGVLLINWITRGSRISPDAAMVVVLGLFYGGGMVILRMIVHSSLPNRGGINQYMFGNASTLTNDDLVTIALLGGLTFVITALFWKELKVFTFDPVLSHTMGFSSRILSPLMLGTVTLAIVIGIKAVGLILMVAFAIMPAAAARQWTSHLWSMVLTSGVIGGVSGALGSYLAVCLGKVPTGPVVVVVLFFATLVSLTAAPGHSILYRRSAQKRRLQELLALGEQADKESI